MQSRLEALESENAKLGKAESAAEIRAKAADDRKKAMEKKVDDLEVEKGELDVLLAECRLEVSHAQESLKASRTADRDAIVCSFLSSAEYF